MTLTTATRCRCSRRRTGSCSVPASSSRCGRSLLAQHLVRHLAGHGRPQQRRAGDAAMRISLSPLASSTFPLL
jgi:hypothetical protein